MIIKKWNLKIQHAVTLESHFSPLLISLTEFLPFSNGENLHQSVQTAVSFHYGKPRRPYTCISLLLVYTLSTPVHPAWAGMENPTSVYTEAQQLHIWDWTESYNPDWGQFNVRSPSLTLSSQCQPRVYTGMWVCRGTVTCLPSILNKPKGAGRITVTNSGL